MNRFCRDLFVMNIPKPVKFAQDFTTLIAKLNSSEKGTLKDIRSSAMLESAIMSSR